MLFLDVGTGVIVVALSLVAALLVAGIITNLLVRVPYVPTPAPAIIHALQLLQLQSSDHLVDLGCGDGRFVFAAAAQGAQATGYELSIPPLLRAHAHRLLTRSPARIRWQNFLTVDLTRVNAVFIYLVESVLPVLSQKLSAELPVGARIVCYGMALPGWTPTQVDEPVAGARGRFYLYVKS